MEPIMFDEKDYGKFYAYKRRDNQIYSMFGKTPRQLIDIDGQNVELINAKFDGIGYHVISKADLVLITSKNISEYAK